MTDADKVAYGRLLAQAMRRRRLLAADVAQAVGAATQSVSAWLRGTKLPQMDYSVALAEVLADERLVTHALRMRTRSCGVCGAEFVDLGKQPKKKYCKPGCAKTAHARKVHGRTENRYKLDRSALTLHRESVARYCADCEPQGICRTAECPLRAVSPLPLVDRERPATAVEPRASERMLAYVQRRYAA